MGQTPVYHLPYPELTSPADVPADIRALADRLDLLLQPAAVTALPASPVDGQEIYYVADSANSVIWHLRYRAAAGTYKWEHVGGGPLFAETSASTSYTTGSPGFTAGPALAAPKLTLPLAGIYAVSTAAAGQAAVAIADWRLQIWVNGTIVNGFAGGGSHSTTMFNQSPAMTTRVNVAAGGAVVDLRAASGGAAQTITYFNRFLSALPVAVG